MNTNPVLLHCYTWNSHSAVLWYFRLRSGGKILRSEGVMSLFFHFLIAWPSFPCVHWEFFNWKWKFLYLSPDYHSRWRAIKINEWRCASVRVLKNCWGRLNTLPSHLGLLIFSYCIFHLTFGLHSKGKGREGNHAACVRLASVHMCTSVRARVLARKKDGLLSAFEYWTAENAGSLEQVLWRASVICHMENWNTHVVDHHHPHHTDTYAHTHTHT